MLNRKTYSKKLFKKMPRTMLALLAASCMTRPVPAAAQVDPANSATTVYESPNGVPVVNIANPNGAGLSHNQYNQYNVDSRGLVLNNGDISQISRTSQLAGQVAANLNLSKEASVILNEVVAPNRSSLAGYTEVVGRAADVIVANPYGITCEGCGFINTPNVTLTTGVPTIGGSGALTGFQVDDGDILITGGGIDGSKQDYLALIARTVKLQGQVNADALDVVAGANDWDYATKTATARTPSGTAPTYAIDSSALGGMYANRIRLIATEDGVGVRMNGEAAAGVGDFTITASGKVEINSAISAEGDVDIASSYAGTDVVHTTDAKISARKNLRITATSGEIHLEGGTLTAGNDLTLDSDTLTDEATGTAGTDNNKRYAGNDLTLDQAGAVSLDGAIYGAAGALSADTGSLTAGAGGATIYGDTIDLSANGALALNKAAIKSTGAMALESVTGAITIQSGGTQGIESTGGNIVLTAATDLTNGGAISADAGDLTANIGDTLTNSGTVQAGGALALNIGGTLSNNTGAKLLSGGDQTIRGLTAASYTVNNSGEMTATGGVLDIKGNGGGNAVIINSGSTSADFIGHTIDWNASAIGLNDDTGVTADGDLAINTGSLSLGGSNTLIIAGDSGSGTGTITVSNSFTNAGHIHSKGDLTLSGSTINNSATGAISALNDLTLIASSNVDNSNVLYAGNNLTATASGTFYNHDGGTMDSGNDISVTAGTFINNYDVNAKNDLTINAHTFENEVTGGDQRAWTTTTPVTTDTGWSSDPEWLIWGQSADKYHTRTWQRYQYYVGGAPTHKPQLLADGILTVTGFQTGLNLGGVISAPTVKINTTLSGASFTNDSYDLTTQNWKETWKDHVYCCDNVVELHYTYGEDDTSFIDSSSSTPFGAGIFANTLEASGFSLTNVNSVVAANPTATSANGATGSSFGGITITLPANPNGFFVLSKDPNSKYLIETNPLYADPNALGSDYLAKLFGIDPELEQRRLGDATYENYLVRQELIAQTGSNILIPGESEAQQMQRLMDNGAEQGKALGLTYGQAPTEEQLASLTSDMVWMVETEVNGEKVLAPVVYLSQATKDAITGDAVIMANNVNMNLDSVTNTGGTIQGTDNLAITSRGDVTNTSGTIKGGDVSIESTEGSIVNQTYSQSGGNDQNGATVIGKQAGIEATGDLDLDAKKDITNLGANMSAGGDASLDAGGNITFDTVEDREASTTHDFSGGNTFDNDTTSTTESSVTNIRSGLTVGGSLSTNSGEDTTFAGTDVKVGGDADVNAGGDLNILSRDDTKSTSTSTTHTGAGVGGGVYGTETTTTDTFHSTNMGTNFEVGGDGSFTAGDKLTIQGSDVSTGGDMSLKGDDVEIIEGRDIDRTTTTKSTTTFLSIDDGAPNESEQEVPEEEEQHDASVSAEASASTESHDAGGVNLSDTKTTTTDHYKSTANGSSVKSGGNMTIESNNDLTVRGSDVEAGGNVDLDAKNINIEAAEDIDTTTTTTSRTQVGLYGKSDNEAGADAGAEAWADGGGADADAHGGTDGVGSNANAGDAAAGASANAEAEASTKNSVDLMRTGSTTTTTTDITHQGSTIKSGGNMSVNADNQLNVQGSDMESGGDMDLKAKDMSFTAAEDVHVTTTTSTKTNAGLYADGDASASAGAEVEAGAKTGASGDINASADANAGVGLQGSNTTSSSTSGSTTAQTSHIKAGGNMTREADGKITDEGTQIEAGGDFTQSAEEWDSKAAKNTTFSTDSSETNSARLGLYGEAGASVDAGGEAGMGIPSQQTDAGADASAGLEASYHRETSDSSSSSSQAVTSSIKVGGNMKTTTTGATTLEGTNLQADGDMELNAGSLDYKAATNTSSSSSSSDNIDAGGRIGIDATKAVTGSISGGYGADRESESSTQAVTGGMNAGGNLKINTKDDAHFEGTNIEAGGDGSIKAGGDVIFDAAHDTSTSSSGSENVDASLSASKSKSKGTKAGFEASGGFDRSSSESSDAVTGSIKTGGKLDVSAGGDATFEGTGLESGGDMGVEAGGDVNFNAAKSTSSETSYGMDASLSAAKGGKSKSGKKEGNSGGFSIDGNYSTSDETTSKAGSLKSGGAITVKSGNDTNLEGTNIESTGKTSLNAGGDVNFDAAKDTKSALGVGGGLNMSNSAGADAGLSLDVSGGKSTAAKAGSINAGEIEVNAGGDANFEGTGLNSTGDTSIKAGDEVNFNAAKSTSIDGSLSGSIGTGGGMLNDAGIGGGVTKEGAEINTGGSLDIQSGSTTTFEGTQANVEGSATVDAGGGVVKKTNVSGSGQIGTSRIGADLDVQQTHINAKGGYNE